MVGGFVGTMHSWYAAAPMDVVLLIFCLAVGLAFYMTQFRGIVLRRQRWLRDVRIRIGCCAECGYDLRASPLRCPECGAIPDAAERARVGAIGECGVLRYLISGILPLGAKRIRFNRFSTRARLVVGLANNVTAHGGEEVVYPRHLLAALAVEGSGVGAGILRALGVDLAAVAERMASGLPRDEPSRLDRKIAWEL